MRNFLLFAVFLYLSASVFFSCESTDDDNTNPRVEYFNISDTLYIGDDTINRYEARFWDDKGISTYKIQVFPAPWFDRPDSVVRDSVALRRVKVWSGYNKDTLTVNPSFYLPQTYTYYDSLNSKYLEYPVRTGDYIIRLACMDIKGNYDSIDKQVVLVYPATEIPPLELP